MILDTKKYDKSCREGFLPSSAPLANPYVPFQVENPPKYEAAKGMIRGTLFPGLELPFMGIVNQKEQPVTPLSQLQAMAFALQELTLYLDTHREDQEALEVYRTYQSAYHKAVMEYSQKYGPINHGIPTDGPYRWLDDPWPWEYCANREG
jgi:spore coat protein JB